MPRELISKHLRVPFVELAEKGIYLCNNGVAFTEEEYQNGTVSLEELARREKEEQLYDYVYAKNTGILRKKRSTVKKEEIAEETSVPEKETETVQMAERETEDTRVRTESSNNRRIGDTREYGHNMSNRRNSNSSKSVLLICTLLAFTSAISMYISTLHTATYLTDYADLISAWLMSASVTAYNGTAFEVSVMFKEKKRYFMSIIFMFLWVLVTLFSMATTVSVFYDSFNFNEYQIAEENKEKDSNKLALELLAKKEADLREAISFKKKDIEYRQEREFATTAVRNELTKLEVELQKNLSEQQEILEATPEVREEKVTRKESLFAFLGRLLHLEGGILEFIMSTLSAIFVNLIAPLSLTAVTELLKKEK